MSVLFGIGWFCQYCLGWYGSVSIVWDRMVLLVLFGVGWFCQYCLELGGSVSFVWGRTVLSVLFGIECFSQYCLGRFCQFYIIIIII